LNVDGNNANGVCNVCVWSMGLVVFSITRMLFVTQKINTILNALGTQGSNLNAWIQTLHGTVTQVCKSVLYKSLPLYQKSWTLLKCNLIKHYIIGVNQQQ